MNRWNRFRSLRNISQEPTELCIQNYASANRAPRSGGRDITLGSSSDVTVRHECRFSDEVRMPLDVR